MDNLSFTLKQAVQDLIHTWCLYLKPYIYFKKYAKSRKIFMRKLMLIVFSIFSVIACFFWWVKNIVYGQEAVGQTGVPYAFVWDKFLSLALGSGLISMFIRFARKRFLVFKRAFDLLVASPGLVLLSPLFLIVAILIKFDSPGPVFFKQERFGQNSKRFNMWKFRTMRYNAELETGPVWASQDDPRITKLGHFIRRAHIDELPQLVNVFMGQMSLIGPRPERPEFVEKINGYVPNFNARLKVKPGITGLAQVRYQYGASIQEAARKLKYDILYIKKMCWALEFKILYWTLGRVLTGEGAR